MILENILQPFNEWIGPALRSWFEIAILLIVAATVLGLFVAAVRNGPIRGLVITGRALRDGVVDIFCMSPRRLWGLTWLSVKDSIRRRVLVVFVFFLILLLFAGWFLDPSTDHPLRLYLSFILTSTSYLVLVLVLFLSAFSIPNELKNKTLHTVVTKPVRASEIVLGRMLGFALVGTVLLVVMGLISYVFVVRGLVHTHDLLPAKLTPIASAAGVDDKDVPLEGKSEISLGHLHEASISSKGTGRLEMTKDHWHSVTRKEGKEGEKPTYEVSGPEGLFIARVPVYGSLRFLDRDRNETDKGINVGDEWSYRSFIDGGSLAAAIWTFKDVDPNQFATELPIEATLAVFRTHKGNIEEGIPGSISIRNPKTGLTVEARIFKAKEFKTNVERIPRKITPTNVYFYKEEATGEEGKKRYVREEADAETRAKAEFDIFEDLSDNGTFEIWLQCLAPGQYYGAAQADLYLHARDASFGLNFIKGYFGIWMQMLLVIGFGVMFSTFLSGPIATLATVGMLIGGFFREYMIDLATGKTYGGGPVESFIRILTQQNVVVEMEAGLRTTVAKSVDAVLLKCLYVTAHLLPEFGKYSAADYVSYGFNTPANWIAQQGLTALGFVVVLFIAGYFFLKTREVAR